KVEDVQGPVGAQRQVDRPEPVVGRGQELAVLLPRRAAGDEGGPGGDEHVAVDEVVGRVADEGGAAVLPGEGVGIVDDRAAGGGDEAAGDQLGGGEAGGVGAALAAAGALDAPGLERADAEHPAGGAVVGDVEGDGRDGQGGVAAQVVVGQDHVAQVL